MMLADIRLLTLLALSFEACLASVCKLFWEETVLLCIAKHRSILSLQHDANKEHSEDRQSQYALQK